MKKLKLPEYDTFEEAYNEYTNSVYCVTDVNRFHVCIEDEYDCLYGYISTSIYYDDATAKTDDFNIKIRSKRNLKRTYNKIIKQLNTRYKEWVDSLYVQGGE